MGYTGDGKDRNIWTGRLGVTEQDPKHPNDLTTKNYVDVEILTCWLKSLGQTGLTGDKSGSFNLTTTGTGTFTNLTADTDTLVVGSGLATFTGPSFPLATFERQVAGTTGAWTVNRFQATSAGNMVNTFGPYFAFSIEDNAGTVNDIAIMGAARQDNDVSGRFQVRTKSAGNYHATGFNIDKNNRIGLGVINPQREVDIVKSQNSFTAVQIKNTNTGNSASTGFILENDVGICLANFYGSNSPTASNKLYFKNEVGGVSFVGYTGTSIGFGTGTSIADADDLIIQSNGDVDTAKNKISVLGGICIKMTNKTGANTIQGTIVKPDTATDDAFILCATSDQEVIGVVLDSGVADGSEAWVVVGGIADVAFEDNTAATRQDWVSCSTSDAGYCVGAAAAPGAVVSHFREVGHCIESVAAGGAGTRILARCVLHFN